MYIIMIFVMSLIIIIAVLFMSRRMSLQGLIIMGDFDFINLYKQEKYLNKKKEDFKEGGCKLWQELSELGYRILKN